MKTLKSHRIALSTLTVAILTTLTAQAAAPDAGQTSRELEQQPVLTLLKGTPSLQIKVEGAPANVADSAQRITVKSLRISGNSVIASSELDALVADLSTGERSFAELNTGVARITALYRQRGYAVARAYLPAQDIKDGAVEIRILEGNLGQQNVTNNSKLSDARVNGYLSGVQSGQVIKTNAVDRALLLMSDLSGVGGARATLQPGASVGTSDLLVELDPTKPYAANLELDNYGNRYTGEYRVGASVALNSPLGIGDLLSLRGITSGDLMSYARLAYQLPIGVSGFKVGGAYSDTRYKLGEEFAALQQHGTASSSSLFATYPFVRSQTANLSGTLTWEDKKLIDQTDRPVSNVEKKVQLVTLGLAGNRQDALWGGGMTGFDFSIAAGDLSMDATSLAQDVAAGSANSNGSFTKFTYTFQRQQRVSTVTSLYAALTGQQASKNLNSSEKFSLGGANGVRAYPQGEGSGDQGMMVNLEVRRNVTEQLQASVFYDAGTVDINRNQFLAGVNSRFISGAGFALSGQVSKLQFKTSVAWRTSGGDPVSDTVNRDPRFWVQASLPF
jgi:hemolysin activation/secretion protein